MTQNYQRKHVQSSRRKSTTFPIFVYEEEQLDGSVAVIQVWSDSIETIRN